MMGETPGPAINQTLTVAEVLSAWPATARVFLRRGMACVGCAMAPFDTLAEVAQVYGLASGDLVDDLVKAALEVSTTSG